MFNFWGPLSSFATGPWTSRGGAADKRSGGAAWRPTFQLSVKLVIARWWLVIRCCWWWRQRWNISDWCTYPHAFEAKRLTSKYRQRHRISNGTNWHSPITQSHSLVGTIHCSTGGSQNHVFTCNHFLWLTFQVFTCFWLENLRKMSTLVATGRSCRATISRAVIITRAQEFQIEKLELDNLWINSFSSLKHVQNL